MHAAPGNMNLSRTFGLQTSPLEVALRIVVLLQARLTFRGVMSEASQESQGLAQWNLSWKLFTCTNLADPYFQLRSADMASTKLSFLKVLRKDKMLIKKNISDSSLLGRLSPFSLKPHKSQEQSCHFFKLLQIFCSWPMNTAFIITSWMETKYCQVSLNNSCWNVAFGKCVKLPDNNWAF